MCFSIFNLKSKCTDSSMGKREKEKVEPRERYRKREKIYITIVATVNGLISFVLLR